MCVVAPRGACMVAPRGVCMVVPRGGMHGCSRGACVVAPRGGMHGCSRGACVVAPGGMCGCSRGCGCSGGMCMVALGGHAWDTTRYGDTVNERAVRILLECILVHFQFINVFQKFTLKQFLDRMQK